MYLEKINGPEDVKKIKIDELPVLAQEIRDAILVRASKHGGHFGPNFGMVEATIALHYVFESPKDKIVYDVSHQSYPHKMLTGRKEAYLSEQHYDDVSGYTNPNESEHDFFTVGHTSTSVSLAAGLAKARDLKGENGNVIAVIGDGSLSGGEALEGLDFAAELQSNFIIIVNDNDMSIAENHGGLYQNLALLRKTDGQAECNLFKAMGLDYVYVDRGNDVAAVSYTHLTFKYPVFAGPVGAVQLHYGDCLDDVTSVSYTHLAEEETAIKSTRRDTTPKEKPVKTCLLYTSKPARQRTS